MVYYVIKLDIFKEKAKKHNIPEKRIEKICKELKINPYIGRMLEYDFFREKRYRNKRIYYLIYKEFKKVLLVNVSDKKDQEKVIKVIKANFLEFKNLVSEKFTQ